MRLPSIDALYPYSMWAPSTAPVEEPLSPISPGPARSPLSFASPSPSSPSTPSINALDRLVYQVRGARVEIEQVEELDACGIHPMYLLTPSDGSPALLLTLAPRAHVKTLRIEQRSLETQLQLHRLLDDSTNIAVPPLLASDLTPKRLGGSPFLLTTCPRGQRVMTAMDGHVSEPERESPDEQANAVAHTLSQVEGPFFGLLHWGPGRKAGGRSWRQAFSMMVEDALRDGEEMLVALPYEAIRACLAHWASALDDVTVPRLVWLDPSVERASASTVVLVNEEDPTRPTGLMLSGAWIVWGDPLLGNIGDDEDDVSMEEGQESTHRRRRIALYTIYRSVLAILEENYRPSLSERRELEARKRLTSILGSTSREIL
ncbi:MAG: hypothetical protein M1823_006071 [Watsoniomyces obsoletus]|nr:MAG: hypothetical protein M1823_006071 [Watsoniomyces obsoletus]